MGPLNARITMKTKIRVRARRRYIVRVIGKRASLNGKYGVRSREGGNRHLVVLSGKIVLL